MSNNKPEKQLGKTYELKIIRWLFKYCRPYTKFMIICFVLMVITAMLELLVPYLAKIAVDKYISPSWTILKIPIIKSEYEKNIISKNKNNVIKIDNRSYLVNLEYLKSGEKVELERKKTLSIDRFVVIDPSKYNEELRNNLLTIINNHKNYFRHVSDFIYIKHENLNKLNKSEIALIRNSDLKNVVLIAIAILGCMILIFLFTTAFTYLLNYSGHKIMHTLRSNIFSHILSLPQAFFDKNPVGRLSTRVTNDVNAINELYTSVLVQFCKDLVVILGILIIMFILNRKLTVLMFIFTLIVGYTALKFRMRLKDVYRKVRISIAKLNSYVQESIRGITLIKLYNRESNNFMRFKAVNDENFSANMDQLFAFATFRPIIEFISIFSIAVILWYGGRNVISLNITLGALIAYLYYVRMLFRPIQELAEKYNIFQSAIAASENLYDLSMTRSEDKPDRINKMSFNGKIEFRNVWFAYKTDEWVLKDVSFVIKPGDTVALVGLTGSGKTTIVNLILKFYQPSKGNIYLDDIDISNYNPEFIRTNIASVFQDTFLVGNNDSDQTVYTTVSAPRGIFPKAAISRRHYISSGEKQLVSLEKAFSKHSNFLILDEATSHIDASIEQEIQRRIKANKGRATTLIIAHRLSNIKDADEIIVIHKGMIVERGPHISLVKNGGIYSNLDKLQSEITRLEFN